MIQKTIVSFAFLVTLLLANTSYAIPPAAANASELSAVLKTISQGESKLVTIVGELRPYSGKFFKGKGLSEIAVGEKTLLIRSTAKRPADMDTNLNKTVRAVVKISHLPLADSKPASQLQGYWITEISELKAVN